MTTTEDRVHALETQVRRQRRWNIALGVVLVGGGLMAATGMQEVPDVIRAKKFEVINDTGHSVVHLNSDPDDGHGGLVITDSREKPIAAITARGGNLAGEVNGYALLKSNNGLASTMRLIGTRKQGMILIHNDQGKPLVAISGTDKGGQIFVDNPRTGQSVVAIGVELTGGEGMIETRSAEGKKQVRIGSVLGSGCLSTYNESGDLVRLVD